MAALTTLGIIHTAISLVALGAGVRAFVRYKEISPTSGAGLLYIVMTILTCISSFFIFEHGGFGKPHVLAIVTLLVLGVATAARFSTRFGRASAPVETVSYSLTFFFHMIPAVTETATRLPYHAPLLAGHDAPELVPITGLMFLVFLVGAVHQVRRLRASAGGLPFAGGSVHTV